MNKNHQKIIEFYEKVVQLFFETLFLKSLLADFLFVDKLLKKHVCATFERWEPKC